MKTDIQTDSAKAVGSGVLLGHALSNLTGVNLESEDFDCLKADEIQVLYLRLVEGKTLKETGSVVMGRRSGKPADRERIRLMQAHAIRKLQSKWRKLGIVA